ncbi:MAG: hypothetical protein Q8O67_22630 [Deltaproteobacteria bacterium]|nr:hypothetical protein [Deltaproteobacteria bacterium]
MVCLGVLLAIAAVAPSVVDPVCDESVEERTVSVRVRPWADVFVDGRSAARAVVSIDLALSPGAHVLTFRNPAAIEVHRVIIVPTCDEIAEVAVELVRRPALLSVKSNVPDAELAVCGPRVFVRTTEREPIHVSMPADAADTDVLVARTGYAPVVKRVKLHSGRRTRIAVRLHED